MLEALLIFLIVLLIAGAAYWLAGAVGLPHPIPLVIAGVIVIVGLIWLVGAVDTGSVDDGEVD